MYAITAINKMNLYMSRYKKQDEENNIKNQPFETDLTIQRISQRYPFGITDRRSTKNDSPLADKVTRPSPIPD